jgi:D-aminoacyl-tRNA deacylase
MRAVVQRVREAAVDMGGVNHARIGRGLLILLGVTEGDGAEEIEWLAGKIARMRLFADDEGKMNRSVAEVDGSILVISQFTLYASTKKGNRPSFLGAAHPQVAEPAYERFCELIREIAQVPVLRGVFGADMQVHLCNDGPVTIVIDSRDRC